MRTKRLAVIATAVLLLLSGVFSIARAEDKTVVLDAGNYKSVDAARALWTPIEGSPLIEIANNGALRLPGNFDKNQNWRVAWDQAGSWDFSSLRKIVLDITDNPDRKTELIKMRIYFYGVPGWSYNEFDFARGDCRIEIPQSQFLSAGETPASWNNITAVRLELQSSAPIPQAIHIKNISAVLSLSPDTIQELYSRRKSELGQVAGFSGQDALKNEILSNIKNFPAGQKKAGETLKGAEQLVVKAQEAADNRDFEKGVKLLEAAQQEYRRSYVDSVPGKPGEIRAFCCGDPRGTDQGNDGWDSAMKSLAIGGFNAVMPTMSYAGTVAYKSDLLPLAAFNSDSNLVYNNDTDSLAECVAAGKKYGVKVFAVKISYWLWDKYIYPNDKSLYPKLVAENRLQVDNKGKVYEDHICPSNPENQKLEVATFLELVKNYDVAGIMFDFIRYGSKNYCYCTGCRQRFEAQYKLKVENWPIDVFSGPLKEQYRQFRRDNITAVVAAVSQQARLIRPGILITAAVITDGAMARDIFGQDWKLWLEKSYLDFVLPMIYTPQKEVFEASFRSDRQWAGPQAKLVPCIGKDWQTLDQTLAQIVIARKYGADGFNLFNYGAKDQAEIYQSFLVPEAVK